MEQENRLGTEDVHKLVIKLAFPAMAAQFVSVLYSITDRIFVSHMPVVGETALTAIGVCAPIVTIILSFATLIGVGGAPLMGIKLGEGNKKEASKYVANAFLLLIIFSIVCTAIAFFMRKQILFAFGASEAIYPYAEKYFKIYVLGTIFALLGSGMNQYILSQGFAKNGMIAVIIGAVINIALDPVFIYVLNLGIVGAAIATVIGQIGTCVYVLHFLLSDKPPIRLTFGNYFPALCLRILKTGFVPFLTVSIDNVLLIEVNMMLQKFGGANADLLVGCMAIVQSFMLIITMPLGGITGGTQAILSYNFGAGNAKRVMQSEKYIIMLCFAFCVIMFTISQTVPQVLVRIFTSDTQYMTEAVRAIKIYTLGIIGFTFQWPVVDGLIGMGQVQRAIPLSLIRKGMYFVAVLIIPRITDITNIFYAAPISDILGSIITAVVFALTVKKVVYRREQIVHETM